MEWMISEFKKETGIDLSQDKMAEQRLKEAAEKAKIELSTVLSTNINLPFITADATGPKHLDLTLTRAKFNELTEDLVQATMEPTKKAIADSGYTIDEIDKIILVGGSSRIPLSRMPSNPSSAKNRAKASTPMNVSLSAQLSRPVSSSAMSKTSCFSMLRRFLWALKPSAVSSPRSSTATRPSRLPAARSSRQLSITSRLSTSTSFRANVKWQPTTRPSAALN